MIRQAIVIIGIGAAVLANAACSAEVIDIYMVGNSYTDDSGSLGTYDEMILFAESATRLYGSQFGVQFNVTSTTFGGRTMFGHTQNISNTSLANGGYEHIILQEQSQLLAAAYDWFPAQLDAGQNFFTLHRANRGYPGSEAAIDDTYVDEVYYGWYRMLNTKIGVHSPNSMVHVFQTWGRTSGFIGGSYEEHLRRNVIMADDIQEEAASIGLNAVVGRAGEAWDHIFDTTSLTLHRDGSHANAQGYYLAAATLFQNILNEEMPGVSIADLDYNPHGATGTTLMDAAIVTSGVVPVPEPSAMVMALLGALLVLFRRKQVA